MPIRPPGDSAMTPLQWITRPRPFALAASFVALAAAASVAAPRAAAAQGATGAAAHYHVTRVDTLGGDGGWDYVLFDAAGQRLFIGRSDRVMVVSAKTGKLLGEVHGIDGAHGVALAPHTNHGFATSGRDASVVMFDSRSYKVLSRIPAADDADAILYDPASDRVFSFNGDANSATVIEPHAGKRFGAIDLRAKPEFGVSDGRGKLFVNLEDSSAVAEIDPKSMKVVR